jgi:pyruvate ferredoxin oxidoreductase gamma subunit
LRISDKPIVLRDEIYNPDYVVVMDPTLIGVVKVEAGIKENGMIVANYPKGPEELKEKLEAQVEVVTINATKFAMKELGRPITNTAMVGAFIGATKLIKLETLKETIVEWFKDKAIAEKNVRLVEMAYKSIGGV